MTVTATSLAQSLGMTPQALRSRLRALGLDHARGSRWAWKEDSPELHALKEKLHENRKADHDESVSKAKPKAKPRSPSKGETDADGRAPAGGRRLASKKGAKTKAVRKS